MKLILLPGMDGTGILFEPLLRQLNNIDYEVISLPKEGNQDYFSLAKYVISKLPDTDFILLAESFSGFIAAEIAHHKTSNNLKGIIFVASFLSPPSRLLAKCAYLLPIKFFIRLPFASVFIRQFFLGKNISRNLIDKFIRVVESIPAAILKSRLSQITKMDYGKRTSPINAHIIVAGNDFLVRNKSLEIQTSFPNSTTQTISGPHFILQAKPEECALIIRSAIDSFSRQDQVT